MPRPRKPTSVLQLRGAFAKNPARLRGRENEPQPTDLIGEPPAHLPPAAAACWVEITSLAHAGTLCRADRILMEHVARILAMLRERNWDVDSALMIRLERGLACLGLTPSDRSRVTATKPQVDWDEIDEALNF
jgi:phage terminase small subunit